MSTLATIFTDGIPGIFYGLLRPLAFLFIAWAVWQTPRITREWKVPMIAGALGNFTAAAVFLFVNAGLLSLLPASAFWLDYAALVSTPALLIFTFGLIGFLIEIGGLSFGRHHK